MEYFLLKKKIKNFVIRIYPDKSIKISVPVRATKKEVENFISSKKAWILKTLEKMEVRSKQKEEKESEENVFLFGRKFKKNIILYSINRIEIFQECINVFVILNEKLFIEKILLDYKIKILSEVLDGYIEKYSRLLNTEISYYKIKKLKATWGIYHKKENYISFNLDLVHKEKNCIEYVVLHEMSHIFYMNHGKEFWNLVEFYMPDYKIIKRKLKY